MKALLVDEDSSFVSQLSKQLQEEYTKRRSDKVKEVKEQFKTKYDEYFSNKDKGIKEDKFHKEVLNSCIFPFVQTGLLSAKSDYAYLCSSPLSELGVKNVDFLIASQSKGIAIFGEAKGSIEDPNRVISQYRDRMKVINEHLDEVKKFVPNLTKIEFVLGVPSMDAMETIKAILRSNINIILWEVGGMGEQQLSVVVPPNVDERTKNTVMHSDKDLNRLLSKVATSREYKTFFHESHPVTKMSLLSALDKNPRNSFSYTTVKKIVEAELDNTDAKEIDRITRDMITLSININFVNCKDDGHYKIQSIYKNAKSRYDELRKKWIDFRFNQDLEAHLNEEITKIQQEFAEKQKKQLSLEEYFR